MDGDRTPPNDDGLQRARRALRAASSIDDAFDELRRAGPFTPPPSEPRVRVAAAIGDEARAGGIASLLAQTDFVANGDEHARLVELAARLVLAHAPRDAQELRALCERGGEATLGEQVDAHARAVGETVELGRFARLEGANGRILAWIDPWRTRGVLAAVTTDAAARAVEAAFVACMTQLRAVDDEEELARLVRDAIGSKARLDALAIVGARS